MSWYAKPHFWSLFYDWMFPPESFDQAKEQLPDMLKLTGLRSGAVLDLGCGPGRYCIPLSQAGFEVTGVDLQSLFLEKAKAYADQEGTTIELIQEDMRRFQRPAAYDLVISMYSSFGYFDDPADDLTVLRHIFESLKPGGRFLLDLRGKEVHAMNFRETISSAMPNGDLIIQRTRNTPDWTKAITSWIYLSGNRAESFEVSLNIYSGVEMRTLLLDTGFSDVRLFGGLKGSPYDHTAKRLIVLAEKG